MAMTVVGHTLKAGTSQQNALQARNPRWYTKKIGALRIRSPVYYIVIRNPANRKGNDFNN